jgi:methionine-rich copper-binding protein CopC
MPRALLPCLALLGLLLTTTPASAHAHLQSSIPTNGARLAASPTTLTLGFSESARLTALSLRHEGKPLPLALDPDAKAAARIVVPLPALSPGLYEVDWRVIAADDGHVTHGSFSFTVGR